jgi:DNA-directed RNA polymerase subunit M/transcription elongation factor TFIIS
MPLEFCPDCENMLYILEELPTEGGEEGVRYRCRKCPFSKVINHEHPLLYEHNLKEDAAARIIENPYLTRDPTLPRFDTIQCPTEGCPSKDVVGVKLDKANIVWMYQCAVCNAAWKQVARRG